jgi:hypothetical protein
MPKLLRPLPRGVFAHLLERADEREITVAQLALLARWVDGNPEVPAGRWFKRFPRLIVCGEGELVKTFLRTGQAPDGQEVI